MNFVDRCRPSVRRTSDLGSSLCQQRDLLGLPAKARDDGASMPPVPMDALSHRIPSARTSAGNVLISRE